MFSNYWPRRTQSGEFITNLFFFLTRSQSVQSVTHYSPPPNLGNFNEQHVQWLIDGAAAMKMSSILAQSKRRQLTLMVEIWMLLPKKLHAENCHILNHQEKKLASENIAAVIPAFQSRRLSQEQEGQPEQMIPAAGAGAPREPWNVKFIYSAN